MVGIYYVNVFPSAYPINNHYKPCSSIYLLPVFHYKMAFEGDTHIYGNVKVLNSQRHRSQLISQSYILNIEMSKRLISTSAHHEVLTNIFHNTIAEQSNTTVTSHEPSE